VRIFDDRYRWPAIDFQFIENSGKNCGPRSFFLQKREQIALCFMSDVVKRAERSRREKRIARAPENTHLSFMRFRKVLDERSLSDSGLAAHKDEAAITGDYIAEHCFKLAQVLVALEEFHAFSSDYRTLKVVAYAARYIQLTSNFGYDNKNKSDPSYGQESGEGNSLPSPLQSLRVPVLRLITGKR
jgi:hypothetical protein